MNKNILSVAIVVAGLAIAGTIIYLNPQPQQKDDAIDVITIEEAETRALNFINNVMLQGQVVASLEGVSEEYGLYRVDIVFEGQPFSSYMTKDGKLFFPEALDIDELTGYMSGDLLGDLGTDVAPDPAPPAGNMAEFVSCLKENNFVIYGADWCPYCQQVLEMFGGKAAASPIYVECTVEEALCNEKNINAYPTILVNDQKYEGARSLEGFALNTGCSLQ